MQKAKIFKIFRFVLGFGLLAIAVFYASVCIAIFRHVSKIAEKAQVNYSGNVVDALHQMLDDSTSSFKTKNDIVYALGQIGDKGSLKFLSALWTGRACEKPCRKDSYICQYELEKAIRGCSDGFSATRWMYVFLD